MAILTKKDKKGLDLVDNSSELDAQVLQCVLAAMAAGLTEFTTPTPDENEDRIDWQVRRWIFVRDGKPACCVVAQMVRNQHFEIVGPEVPLAAAK